MRLLSDDTKQNIIRLVDTYYHDNGYSPTIAYIAEKLRLAVGTVHKYLHRMNEAGELSFDGRHIETEYIRNLGEDRAAPVSGDIACGKIKYAVQEYGERIILPESLFGKGKFFILRADGESMQNLGVHTGDYIIFRQQNTADEGQHVVALIGDEATFKTLKLDPKKKKVILAAENDDKDSYPDQIFDAEDVIIQGVYAGVIKKA